MSKIEYFYSAHSAYAYLGSARLMEMARVANRRVAHRPMDLRKVVAITGPGSTNGLTPGRRAYFSGREIERWNRLHPEADARRPYATTLLEDHAGPVGSRPRHYTNDPRIIGERTRAEAPRGRRLPYMRPGLGRTGAPSCPGRSLRYPRSRGR